MQIQDDRTPEQRATHTCLVVGTDRFMSGWGKARGGKSYAAWACEPAKRNDCLCWVERRGDMQRVRETCDPYRPQGPGHLHIYVWGDR
jgi:hypothetical protein